MEEYRSASYQYEVMNELSKQAQVYFYGPGFEGYDLNDSIDEVLMKTQYEIDCIIISHNEYHLKNTSGNPKSSFAFKMVLEEIAILMFEDRRYIIIEYDKF